MNPLPRSLVHPASDVKRPKLFVGVWDDDNAYFPHLDGASVMTFEASDLDAIAVGRSAESALAWALFLGRHTEVRARFDRARH